MTSVLYWVKVTSPVSFRNYFQFFQSLKKVQFTGMNILRKKKFYVIHFFYVNQKLKKKPSETVLLKTICNKEILKSFMLKFLCACT